ncbi:MAG TPA: sigma-54 dependent transcriptional regulator [Spirochaetia bacterium]|nr:sigma-54 dependent transcriptional regulator [Spirochaetia bacterium]
MPFTILIVDNELEVCLSLGEILRSRGFGTHTLDDPQQVLPLLQHEHVDLVLMDVRMPDIGGIDLLKAVHERFTHLPVIMISGYASVENAVRAMRYGALNFYTKPIQLPALFAEIRGLERSVIERRPAVDTDVITTCNPQMAEILSLVEKAAPTEASVVISGESGTGKELVADLLHQRSSRWSNAYIKVNCAAIPDSLLESEMFGHEKGAFTDAHNQQKGKVELADGGTIFFDEIGDMSLKTQAKMLRVLQEKRFTRLGGSALIKTDFRVVAATNRDLQAMIKEGSFREDLYYRLAVIALDLPPLRERQEDIPELAHQFIKRYNQIYGREVSGLSPEVVEVLERHNWPGNVRELKNIIERAVIFCEGREITLRDLPEQYRIAGRDGAPANSSLADLANESAREVILRALKDSGGIKGDAARLLNITRKTLYNRMKRLNLE